MRRRNKIKCLILYIAIAVINLTSLIALADESTISCPRPTSSGIPSYYQALTQINVVIYPLSFSATDEQKLPLLKNKKLQNLLLDLVKQNLGGCLTDSSKIALAEQASPWKTGAGTLTIDIYFLLSEHNDENLGRKIPYAMVYMEFFRPEEQYNKMPFSHLAQGSSVVFLDSSQDKVWQDVAFAVGYGLRHGL